MKDYKSIPVIPGAIRCVLQNLIAPTQVYLSYPPSILEAWKGSHHGASRMSCLLEHSVWAAPVTNGQSAQFLKEGHSPRPISFGGNAYLGGAR